MQIIRAALFSVLSLTLVSCSVFAKKPVKITILPIIFGVDENEFETNTYRYPEKPALASAKKLYEQSFEIEFDILDAVYTIQPLEITCNPWEPPPYVDAEETDFINQCYSKLLVLVYVNRNQCTNLLGCSPLSGMFHGYNTLFLYLNQDATVNAEVLEHEMAHMFGAEHLDDGSLMSPAISELKYPGFSKTTIDQVNKNLDRLRDL